MITFFLALALAIGVIVLAYYIAGYILWLFDEIVFKIRCAKFRKEKTIK